MLKAGAIIVALSCVLSVIPVFARDSTVKNFALLMGNILENNCIYFSPVLTVLLGSYMMERETTDDTLKNMLTIPVTFQRIFIGEADGIIGCGQLFWSGQQRFGESFGSGAEITWNWRRECPDVVCTDYMHKYSDFCGSPSHNGFGCLQGGRYAGRDRGCLRLRVPGLHRLEADELLSC